MLLIQKMIFCQKVYISIKNLLHKQSEKACMCFKTRRPSTRDYTVFILGEGPELSLLCLDCAINDDVEAEEHRLYTRYSL